MAQNGIWKKHFAIFGCSHPNRKVPKSGAQRPGCSSCACDSASLASGVYLLNHVKAMFYTARLQTRRSPLCPPTTCQSATPEATERVEKVALHRTTKVSAQDRCQGKVYKAAFIWDGAVHVAGARLYQEFIKLLCSCVSLNKREGCQLRHQPQPQAFIRHPQLSIAGNI